MDKSICKDCGHDIVLSEDKAVGSGEYQTVWSDDSGWVCDVTGDEHAPVPAFTGVPGYETDAWGNPICGHDFMAGTICTDEREHDGGHNCKCLNCGGDWMNETCTCPSETDDDLMDPVEALTYAILAINTAEAPDATSAEDLEYLDDSETAERALAALVRLRDFVIASGEDLPDYVFGKDQS